LQGSTKFKKVKHTLPDRDTPHTQATTVNMHVGKTA